MAATRWIIEGYGSDNGLWILYEAEMRATSGGADQTSTSYAIASGEYALGSSYKENAFDNDTGTTWLGGSPPTGAEGSWIGQDFGSATTVTEIVLTLNGTTTAYTPDEIRIRKWNGSSYETTDTYTSISWPATNPASKTFAVSDGLAIVAATGAYALTGPAPEITIDDGTTTAFKVQHIAPYDTPSGGGTRSITAVSSVNSAIALNNNSRYIGGGPDGSAVSLEVDEASLGVRLTATDTVTLDREAAAAATNRASVSVWEYVGNSGGPNEFIVRDRRTITLTSSDSSAFTPASVGDATALVPFITGIRNTGTTANDHDHGTAGAVVNRSTGEITIYGRGGAGTSVIEVTTLEFTGANWTVHLGTDDSSVADTGTLTLTGSVSDWDNALIVHNFNKNGGGNTAIADVCPTYFPGTGLDEVDWSFDANHDGTAGQRHTVYVIENSDMTVTRFVDTDNSGGDVNVDISSAGLTDLAESLIFVSAQSSGTGTAHIRGVRNAQLTSLTNAQHYVHRSGNTHSIRLQVVKLPRDAASGVTIVGATGAYSLSGQVATVSRNVAIGAATGAYSVAGQTAAVGLSVMVDAATGSYALTGQAATIGQVVSIPAATGTHAMAGLAAALGFGISVAAGVYSLTGHAPSIIKTTAVSADPGIYAVTGQTASLTTSKIIEADAGAYAATGLDAEVSFGVVVLAPVGDYDLTGYAAGIATDSLIQAISGHYAMAVLDADIDTSLTIAAVTAEYSLVGSDAGVAIGVTVGADAGAYAITGTGAGISLGVPAPVGSYALTGHDAEIIATSLIQGVVGTYDLAGHDVAIGTALTIDAVAASYVLTGGEVGLTVGVIVDADAASYVLAGPDVGLTLDAIIAADTGSYVLTGQAADIDLGVSVEITASVGAYVSTGADTDLAINRTVTSDAGSYAVTGHDVSITNFYPVPARRTVTPALDVRTVSPALAPRLATTIAPPSRIAVTGTSPRLATVAAAATRIAVVPADIRSVTIE